VHVTTFCSERHYTKIVSIVADISSDVHYFVFTVQILIRSASKLLVGEYKHIPTLDIAVNFTGTGRGKDAVKRLNDLIS